jgi:hypothetical protein
LVEAKVQEQTQLNSISSNPDEKKLIKWYYDNKVIKSGDVAEDLELARAMANKKTILKVSSELKNSLLSNAQNVSNIGSASVEKDNASVSQKFNEVQLDYLKKRGLDPVEVWKQMKTNEKGI